MIETRKPFAELAAGDSIEARKRPNEAGTTLKTISVSLSSYGFKVKAVNASNEDAAPFFFGMSAGESAFLTEFYDELNGYLYIVSQPKSKQKVKQSKQS